MDIENIKIDLKIFKIDKGFYEIRDKSFEEIVRIIKENHIKKLRDKFKNFDSKLVDPTLTHSNDGEFEYWSYCFRQPKEKFYWKVFLPERLTEEHDFTIVEFSYVLFIKFKGELYCIISGSGMSVIKKYIHPTFGIEIYERLAEPLTDNIMELQIRGVSSNVSAGTQTFNLNQTLSETLNYSDIPTRIKLKIRDELKYGEFFKYDLDPNLAILEIGSYFYIKTKISFEELKQLIIDLDDIYRNKAAKKLTLFSKVNTPNLLKELDDTLGDLIVEDVLIHNNPVNSSLFQSDVIELVHPTKLQAFYECNSFLLKFKGSRGKRDIDVMDRTKLYNTSTKYIYDSLENTSDRFTAKQNIYKLQIVGFINNKETTYANFFSHITAEIKHDNKKYFKVDGHWYLLEDTFLLKMNEQAKEYYIKYRLPKGVLHSWNEGLDEGQYNLSYQTKSGYYVLDKVISDNVELCDILCIRNGVVYFIHVKNGFNAQMRDLYIQVALAAKRLSNDLNNNTGISYLEKTLNFYNNRNPLKRIDVQNFITKVSSKELRITFVMAFKNNHYKQKEVLERIDLCNSNIAKYSLIQVVKEMQQYSFELNLVDISDVS